MTTVDYAGGFSEEKGTGIRKKKVKVGDKTPEKPSRSPLPAAGGKTKFARHIPNALTDDQ